MCSTTFQVQRPLATGSVQVRLLPIQAHAASYTDIRASSSTLDTSLQGEETIQADDENTGTSGFDSDKDPDCDTSQDFVPSRSEDSEEGYGTREMLLLATQGMIMEKPIWHGGRQSDCKYLLDTVCEKKKMA